MSNRARVLIVDDNPTNERILRIILGNRYEVSSASSGEEALAKAVDGKPDLILLDVMMPGMDGYEVCRRIRSDESLRFTKIVMVSAKAMLEERLSGYAAGADDYITKPFDDDELRAKVRVHLRLKSIEEVNQLKNDFLGLMSHETRTPLALILGPAEALASPEHLDDDERREWATLLLNGARRIHALHEKILLLCEIKRGAVAFSRSNADLAEILRDAIDALLPVAAQRKVSIEATIPSTCPLWIDAKYVAIAIRAPLENAVRFSPSGGTVRVTLDASEDPVRLRVIDEGPGVAPEFAPRLFDEFTCADVDHHSAGHGLSLAIARHVFRNLGGNVALASGAPGACSIEMTLPAGNAARQPAVRLEAPDAR